MQNALLTLKKKQKRKEKKSNGKCEFHTVQKYNFSREIRVSGRAFAKEEKGGKVGLVKSVRYFGVLTRHSYGAQLTHNN